MMNGMCICCADIKRFNMKENEVERISNYIYHMIDYSKINTSMDYNYYSLFRSINYEHISTHFMCGACYKADTNGLNIKFSKLKQNIVYFMLYLKTIDDRDKFLKLKRNALSSIQGHFPIMYRELDKIKFEEVE